MDTAALALDIKGGMRSACLYIDVGKAMAVSVERSGLLVKADAVIVLDGKTFAPKPSREAQQNGCLYLKGGSAGPCYAIDGPGEIFGPAQTLCLVEE